MTDCIVTKTERVFTGELRVYWQNPDTGETQTTTFHPTALACRAAEYGLTSPADALDVILHEVFQPSVWDDPKDDPATRAGWVTTDGPDAEPISLYTARSTADARGAHRARCRSAGHRVTDPGGLLPALLATVPADDGLYRAHRERVDVTRWHMTYGDLPDVPEGDRRA